MTGVEWTWKKDGTKSAGLVSSQVKQALPMAVKEVSNIEKTDTFEAVNYDAVIGLLVNAVNELSAQIEQMKNS